MSRSSSDLSARSVTAGDELLVHALAQLPERITLTLRDVPLVAEAYGVVGRIERGDRSMLGRGEGDARPAATLAELVELLVDPDDPPAPTDEADPGMLDGERVALVTNIPAPYRLPLFERLDDRLRGAGATLRVFFLADSPHARPWMRPADEFRFEHELLSSLPLPVGHRGRLLPRNLERRLSSFRPTLVVAAGFSPVVAGRAAAVARAKDAAFGIWSGEHNRMPSARSRVQRVHRRLLARAADFGAAYGFEAAEYLRGLRPSLPVAIVRNTSASFVERAAEDRDEVRLLTVGDLSSPRKGIDVLVDALGRARELPCRLTVVGGGALQDELAARADERVRFLGPLQPEQASHEYRDADVFLFPSRADVYGLALVEAMGAGVASITAAAPGAVSDLCVDGRTAVVLPGHEPRAWADAIRQVVADAATREALANAARRTIASRWTIEHSVGAWVAALRLGVLARRARRGRR